MEIDHEYIRESVDCICRDGTDTLISLNNCNGSNLLNGTFISLFIHITWPMSVGKTHRYHNIHKIAKPLISPSSSLSNVLTLALAYFSPMHDP